MNIIQGIYKIVNKTNGKYYVGSSLHIFKRWGNHRKELNEHDHHNKHLESAWHKYGSSNFDFLLIEECKGLTSDELLDVEQHYLDIARSEPDKCYNKCFTARRVGPFKMSDEVKEKIRRKLSNHKKSKLHCKRISENAKVRLSNPKNNSKYDHTIFIFQHKNGEKFVGTRHEFQTKTDSSSGGISEFIRGHYLEYKGWSLLTNECVITQVNQNLS